MLVLIALADPAAPGPLSSGFAVDGELVAPLQFDCTEPEWCRCTRSWSGLATLGFTDLAEVADRPNLTVADIRRALHAMLDRRGVIGGIVDAFEAGDDSFDGSPLGDPVVFVDELIDSQIELIDQVVSRYPVGTVLSRLGQLVAPVHIADAA